MKALYISDLGEPKAVTGDKGEHVMTLPRYAVWAQGRRKPEVIETGNNLALLQATHGPGLKVHLVREGRWFEEV
jgi:hypothetical protein